jgi:uncharacterized protein YqeY
MNIQADMIAAMKDGDKLKVSVLRMLLSEMNYKKINVQRELTDSDILEVIAKEVKKRREAIDSFTAGGRAEQAATEKQELEILTRYLPEMLNEDQIREQIGKMSELKGVTDFGQAMKITAPVFKGKADGALVAKIVKELIA